MRRYELVLRLPESEPESSTDYFGPYVVPWAFTLEVICQIPEWGDLSGILLTAGTRKRSIPLLQHR
jgi:hypothetical protein